MKIKHLLIILLLLSFKTEAQSSVLKLADSLFATGKYSKSIKVYKTYTSQKEIYAKIAKAYNAIGNYDEALLSYKKSVETNPKNVLIKYDYAKLLTRNKKHKQAEILFNELITTDSKNPNYEYQLGLVLEKLKDTTAQNRFYKAYKLDSTHQKTLFKLAKLNLQKRRYDSVNKYVTIGLKSYENNKELISLKAQNFYWQEDYTNGIVWFEKLIALGETSQFIHEKLSFCYKRDYEFEKAIKHQELALKFEPDNSLNLFILGDLYENIDDFIKAEKYYKIALEIEDIPLNTEYRKLGTVLNRLEKHEEAIKAFKKSIKEDPKDEFSHFFLATTKEAYYKDYAAKIEAYESFKKKFPKSTLVGFANRRIGELKKEQFKNGN